MCVCVCVCTLVQPRALCGPSLGRLLMCQLHGSFLSITAAGPGEATSSTVTAPYASHQRYHRPLVDQPFTLQRVWHTAVNKGAALSHDSRTVNEERDFYSSQRKEASGKYDFISYLGIRWRKLTWQVNNVLDSTPFSSGASEINFVFSFVGCLCP